MKSYARKRRSERKQRKIASFLFADRPDIIYNLDDEGKLKSNKSGNDEDLSIQPDASLPKVSTTINENSLLSINNNQNKIGCTAPVHDNKNQNSIHNETCLDSMNKIEGQEEFKCQDDLFSNDMDEFSDNYDVSYIPDDIFDQLF